MWSATLGVIADARGQRRRRLRGIALVALCAALAGAVIAVGPERPRIQAPAAGAPTLTAPSNALSQAPDMGVACRGSSCRAVGLAVWLRDRAASVTATVAGHPMALSATRAFPRPGAGATFVGYLDSYRLLTRVPLVTGPAPTTWGTSGRWPSARVRLRIDDGRGRIIVTRLVVTLAPGWG